MLPCRSRCLRILLTAILGTSVACPSTHTALALSRQSVRAQHASRTREEARTAQHKIDPPHRRALVRFGPADLVSRHRRAMHSGVNSLINATWDDPYVSPEVIKAIQSAALTSAIDPHLLSALAWRESRFKTSARNQRSSATGLLQFTTGTWLQAVRDFGAQAGLAHYAIAVHRNRTGSLVVSEPRVQSRDLEAAERSSFVGPACGRKHASPAQGHGGPARASFEPGRSLPAACPRPDRCIPLPKRPGPTPLAFQCRGRQC